MNKSVASLPRRRLDLKTLFLFCLSSCILLSEGSPAVQPEEGKLRHAKVADVCTSEQCVETASILLESINPKVDPCQDFFEYGCGKYLKQKPVEEDKSRSGAFEDVNHETSRRLKEILKVPAEEKDIESVKKVKTFYAACMNEEKMEEEGIDLAKAELERHGGWPIVDGKDWDESNFDWQKMSASMRRRCHADFVTVAFDSALVAPYVHLDSKDTSKLRIFIDQSNTGFGRDHLLKEEFSEQLSAYRNYIQGAAMALGQTDEDFVRDEAEKLLQFEISIANITVTNTERKNMSRMYNPMTIDHLQTVAGKNFKWLTYLQDVLKEAGEINGETEIIVSELEYVRQLDELLTNVEPRVLANYIGWRFIESIGSNIGGEFEDLRFQLKKVMSGTEKKPDKWHHCVFITNHQFGYVTGRLFAEKYFANGSKEEAEEMIESIRSVFQEDLVEFNWMDDATREKAKEKTRAIRSFIGYPDWVMEDDKLDEFYKDYNVTDQHLLNALNAFEVSNQKTFSQYQKPFDRNRWFMTPAVVNALYSADVNSITFTAGIMQLPFFVKGRLAVQNYGSIGVVIGHEITHGFDDKGRQYDKDGNLQEWWEEEIVERYNKKTQCFVDQYSAFCPPEFNGNKEKLCVNGRNTLGENVADNGGLKKALSAYRNWVKQHGEELRLPGLEEYTSEQLFFLSFANTWCGGHTKQGLRNQLLYNVHSPNKYRVWGAISNSEDFATAFNCPPGSPMNNGEQRCSLW